MRFFGKDSNSEKTDNTEKKFSISFLKNIFFISEILPKIYKKWNSENNNFGIGSILVESFSKIIMILLQDPIRFFSSYKEYIEEIEKRLEKLQMKREGRVLAIYQQSFTTFALLYLIK